MPKYGDDLLLLCRGLQANGAQIFWDTLYDNGEREKEQKQVADFILTW